MAKARNEIAAVFYQQGTAPPQREPLASADRIIWRFADSTEQSLSLATLAPSLLSQAAQFGLKTKGRNFYCDAADLAAAKVGLAKGLATLLAGDWTSPDRESALAALLPTALAAVLGIPVEAAAAKIAKRPDEDSAKHRSRLAQIAGQSAVAVELAKLRAGAPQDLEGLLTS